MSTDTFDVHWHSFGDDNFIDIPDSFFLSKLPLCVTFSIPFGQNCFPTVSKDDKSCWCTCTHLISLEIPQTPAVLWSGQVLPKEPLTHWPNTAPFDLRATQTFSAHLDPISSTSAQAAEERLAASSSTSPAVMNELGAHDGPVHTPHRAQINCQGAAPESVPKYPSTRTKAIHETVGLKIDAQLEVYINAPTQRNS